jgi:hypothetical protein
MRAVRPTSDWHLGGGFSAENPQLETRYLPAGVAAAGAAVAAGATTAGGAFDAVKRGIEFLILR